MDKLTLKEERLFEKIQDQIHFCLNCQARDSGDWIWVMGERYELEQLFEDFDVKDETRDKVIAHGLYCNYCGTQLFRDDEIGLEDKYDKEINKHIKVAVKNMEKE